jgi:translation initiation factor IF-2
MVKKPTKKAEAAAKAKPKIVLREGLNVKEASAKMKMNPKDLLEKLKSKGMLLDLSDIVDETVAGWISKELSRPIELVSLEKEMQLEAESISKDLVPRPPVVTIMGHVDHGKTTLLDAIRASNLVDKESGGITQHIGAYRVISNNRPITFIDTPGHEAFTQLRARGAKVTDIVILVVAADDGVMPQTKEAISHAKAAGVPILVAINKIDKPEANVDRVKQQLSKEGVLVEDWGGDVICVEVSAKEKKNIHELLEMTLLLSDVIELKANPKVKAQGTVLEARLDARKGPVATVIIQHGTLFQGDAFISGTVYGKVRALFDENGKILKKAEPSMPVEVLGFSDVPTAGDFFQVLLNLEAARSLAQYRLSKIKKEEPAKPEHISLDDLFKRIEEGEVKELALIIKADVQGSVEVLLDILPSLSSDKVKIKIVHSGTGNISESDVLLASASNAIIIGYNIIPNTKMLNMAKEENVEIRTYQVIYQLTEDIKKAILGMLEPTIKETYLGRAEIRRIFPIPKIGMIAGCYVLDGKITRNAEIRVLRNKEVIYKGRIASLKHLKENVSEAKKDYECGIGIEKFKDFQEGDIIEAFLTEKVKPV